MTGDVCYARSDDYVSAFMVTSEGIVLVEPIGTEFATWLKGELDRRFHVPVKYVIYSHSHADHASGSGVYRDTARIIGHEALVGLLAMPPPNTPLPQALKMQDANSNGRIERSEAQGQVAALMDFEHFVCSHGRLGTKADVAANLKYREAVVAAVKDSIAAGKTLEQTRDSVLMSEYSGWEFYDAQRALNVTGAYRILSASR